MVQYSIENVRPIHVVNIYRLQDIVGSASKWSVGMMGKMIGLLIQVTGKDFARQLSYGFMP